MIDVTVKLRLDCDTIHNNDAFARRVMGRYNRALIGTEVPICEAEVVEVKTVPKYRTYDVPVIVQVVVPDANTAWDVVNGMVARGDKLPVLSIDEPTLAD